MDQLASYYSSSDSDEAGDNDESIKKSSQDDSKPCLSEEHAFLDPNAKHSFEECNPSDGNPLDSKINSNDIEPTKHKSGLSFFSIESDDETDTPHISIRMKNTGSKFKKDGKPHLPQSSFWQQSQSEIDWDNSRKIWGTSDSADYETTSPPKRLKYKHQYQENEDDKLFNHRNKPIDVICPATSDVGQIASSHEEPIKQNCFFIHHKIAPYLNFSNSTCHIPKKKVFDLVGHNGVVNRVNWGIPQFSHLLCSASMDRTIKIWNIFSDNSKCIRTISHHDKAVKDAIWSESGKEILSCSYDRTVRLSDGVSGREIFECSHKDYVTCVKYHPVNKNWFVSGSLNALFCWDCRNTSKAFRRYVYKEPFGQVQFTVFLTIYNVTSLIICLLVYML